MVIKGKRLSNPDGTQIQEHHEKNITLLNEKFVVCPSNLYNLMRQCWRLAPGKRPTFSWIFNYLNRFENVGDDDNYELQVTMK